MLGRQILTIVTAAFSMLTFGALDRDANARTASARSAQATIIRVVDQFASPIPYAQVWVNGRPPVTADTMGEVRLPKPLDSGARLQVRRIGFAPGDTVVRSLGEGVTVVTLQPTAKGLEEVRTVAERSTPLSRTGFYDRMDRVRNGAITGEFITPEELESRSTGMLSQVFQGRMLVRVSGNSYRPKLTGRAGCAVDILVDGKVINGPLDEYVSGSEIMGVEI